MGAERYDNLSHIVGSNFEMATIKMESFLHAFRIQDTNDNNIYKWKSNGRVNANNTNPKLISYQDPNIICYTYHELGGPFGT